MKESGLFALNFYHLGMIDSGKGRSIMIKRMTMCGICIRIELPNGEWGFIRQNKNQDYLMDGTYWADMSISKQPEQKKITTKNAKESLHILTAQDRLRNFLKKEYMDMGGANDLGTAIRDCLTDLSHLNTETSDDKPCIGGWLMLKRLLKRKDRLQFVKIKKYSAN
jgi:hypothetical protein